MKHNYLVCKRHRLSNRHRLLPAGTALINNTLDSKCKITEQKLLSILQSIDFELRQITFLTINIQFTAKYIYRS